MTRPAARPAVRTMLALSLSLAAGVLLSSCYVDTGSMNVDRFREETRPIFWEPAPTPATDAARHPFRGMLSGYMPVTQAPDAAGTAAVPGAGPNLSPSRPLAELAAAPARPGFPAAPRQPKVGLVPADPAAEAQYAASYAPAMDDGRMLPAIPWKRIDPKFLRQEVSFPSHDKPGTIVVDTKERFLYFVLGDGRAMRYGVGIGREGFGWSGRGVIQWRQRWPRWTPPDEMVQRKPEVAEFSAANGGMNPGLNNPLGARALYIFKDGKDSMFRVHGTPEWQSIGKAVSSGCVRMLNQDVIDLFDRVPEKAEIIVL